jgi:myo-inositol catabolism protein IolC
MTTPNLGPPYEPSVESPLFVLAMDHRASFAETLFGITGEPTDEDLRRMRDAKAVIYDGALQAVGDGLPAGRAGVLVDERLGSDVAARAKADGLVLAMPIERSGTSLFELEYGDSFSEHVEAFDPDFFKVLVRYNPADDEHVRETQTERLARVSEWAEQTGRRWLFELLVPPTRDQLGTYEDQDHFDRQARPALTAEAITEFETAGVHPPIWKLEGYQTADGARQVLGVTTHGDHPALCIVLGRNAPMPTVEHWIEVAAPLEGFVGFAVGRSVWDQALQDLLGGRIDRKAAVDLVSHRYRELIDTYLEARRPGLSGRPRPEPFTWQHPRLTEDRELMIRRALAGADMRGTRLPAWMVATLLAEVEALRGSTPPPPS